MSRLEQGRGTGLALLGVAVLGAGCGREGEGSAEAEAAITGTLLLRVTMDSLASVRTPAIGPTGTTNLKSFDFQAGRVGNAAGFSTGQYASWAAVVSGRQTIELDRGEVELWFRPSYASSANDDVG